MEKPEKNEDRVKVLHTMTEDTKTWLESESQSSGRSVSWLIEHAVEMWRKRLTVERSKRNSRRR